jgi:hypothetical protein
MPDGWIDDVCGGIVYGRLLYGNEELAFEMSIEAILAPIDDAKHSLTVGRAREIALAALNR